MNKELKILLVEDVATDAELTIRALRRAGICAETKRVETEADFRSALEAFAPDIILSDFALPSFNGMEALEIARQECPATPFIFVSGAIGDERAIESLKCGAMDYVLKDNLARLGPAVQRAIREVEERAARYKAEQELHASEQRFTVFMRHLPGVAFIKDLAGRYIFINNAGKKLVNRPLEELSGYTDADLWPAELAARLQATDRAVIEKKTAVKTVEVTPQADGPRSWLVHKFPILDTGGQPHLLGGIAMDITDRVQAEEHIARLSRIHAVLSGINSAIVRIRGRQELLRETCRIAVEHGRFKLAWIGLTEPGTAKIRRVACMGCQEEGYLDENPLPTSQAVDDSQIAERVVRDKKPFIASSIETDLRLVYRGDLLARGYRSMALLPLAVNDQTFGVITLYAAEADVFHQEELRLLSELAGDIALALAYYEKEERLSYLAYYDVLTGLPNRTLFSDRLNQLLRAASRRLIGVLVLDLERFRIINDTLGRHAGDALLKQVAERLKGVAQNPDGLARITADSFALVIPHTRQEADIAHIWENEVSPGLTRPFAVEGEELRISIKAGIALFPNDGGNADTLLANAETALKKAKASRETYLFYTPEINARIAGTLTFENKLRKAVEEEQFVLYYQPKVNLTSGRISGLEALIRWNDPERGIVAPGLFVPLLEETRLILPVGRWVMTRALTDSRRWLAKGLKVPQIAVNVSAIQFKGKEFIGDIITVLQEEKAQSLGFLELEITESFFIGDVKDIITKFKAVREMGLKIAIDDFGTGYSSLSYIAKLPINALKIDRMFISDMTTSPDAMAIVSAIISLAHSLNLKVIAEGVENPEQANLLRLLKCDEAQGYLYSRPVTPEALEALLLADRGIEPV